MERFVDWLDHRTGVRGLLKGALYERIPGGARWRYIWGSTLTFALFAQFVTGIALWAAYSANAQGAWESVYFIQHQMTGGWLLRGIHHYMAQATILLLVLHLMQVLIDGAYRAPREVNFWIGLGLLFLVLALSLTGYLLPWDQKGYWATQVATSIASTTPFVGPAIQQLLMGGPAFGHFTLTRFFALHAGVLPAGIVALIGVHVYLFRRHGVTVPQDRARRGPVGRFWPDQVLKDGVASLAVMATVLALVLWTGGADLGAPADPTEPYAAARPEWYFLSLFQWLKYFPGRWEVVGSQVIPALLVALVACMPLLGRWKLGHRFNLGLFSAMICGVALLTWQAASDDAADTEYLAARSAADTLSDRAHELAASPMGIPPAGGLAMLRADPLTQGPKIFEANCSGCHLYDGHDGLGGLPTEPPSASDLAGFGSREWLQGLLDPDRIGTPEYFGSPEHARSRMVRFVQREVAAFDDSQRNDLQQVLLAVAAEADLPASPSRDPASTADLELGRSLFGSESMDCARCHTFREFTERNTAPTLTGWGSRAWMLGLLHDPRGEGYYRDRNDRMPRFGADGILSPQQMEMVVDWLRGDWYSSPRSSSAPGHDLVAGGR